MTPADKIGILMVEDDIVDIKNVRRAFAKNNCSNPLYVANEGKLVAICVGADAERLLEAMRAHPLGRETAIIGEVIEDQNHFVQMQTVFGGTRMVDWLSGEQLPRIC